ncbi:MAG: M23 family metallopeptidase [Chloroflexota bacterium]
MTKEPHITLECRPPSLIGAHYGDDLPFPNIGPIQEVVFDLGITAVHGTVELVGVVIKAYSGHQLLMEQRWSARIIRQKTTLNDLTIAAGTGLAIRSIHLLIHGFEPLTQVEVTAIGKSDIDEVQSVTDVEENQPPSLQAIMRVPVRFIEQQTDVRFPLRGSWWAIQGADWSDQHKVEVFSQAYAIDFVKLGPESRFFRGDGMALDEHYSWNEPVYATAGGKVAYVCYDMPDLDPGQIPDPRMFQNDPRRLLGNCVAISHGNGEFSFFGHLKQASLEVNSEQLIRRGTLLGYIGNSGHTPGPQLHFQLMEGPNPFTDQGLPVKFTHFEAGGQFFDSPTYIPTRMIVNSEPI